MQSAGGQGGAGIHAWFSNSTMFELWATGAFLGLDVGHGKRVQMQKGWRSFALRKATERIV